MSNKSDMSLRKRQSILTGIVVFSSSLFLQAPATATTLNITVDNLSPAQGVFLSPLWIGFHDGSFNTFDPGATASTGLEIIAEDGLVGLEFTTPEFIPLIEEVTAGFPELPAVQEFTLASLFSDTVPNGLQEIVFENVLGIPPSTRTSKKVEINPLTHQFFSYASMVVPTNDGFIADQNPLQLFDEENNFIATEILILGADVFDAGTEINDENLMNVPLSPPTFAQTVFRGTVENGTIQPHPLLQEPGLGGFLDVPVFSNADFSRNLNAPIARIRIEEVAAERVSEPFSLWSFLFLGASGAKLLKARQKKT